MHCKTEIFVIVRFYLDREQIDMNAGHQRSADAWNLAKKQRYLDSLLREYDTGKLYLQKLPGGDSHTYAVADGKQRLQCMFDFLEGKIPLGDLDNFIAPDGTQHQHPYPKTGDRFSDLSEFWQARFKGLNLSTVIIHGATAADIGDLFLRLNDGKPIRTRAAA